MEGTLDWAIRATSMLGASRRFSIDLTDEVSLEGTVYTSCLVT
jgi:hypothetical protein